MKFPTVPLHGGSKDMDILDTQSIEQNMRRFNCPKERTCLCCNNRFDSEGSHNRICHKCKAKMGEKEIYIATVYKNQRGSERNDCDRKKGYVN